MPVWYQLEMFLLLCLSLYACVLFLCGWCLCGVCVCVCVCLSLLFLIRSQQSVARWELSLSNFCLLIRLSLSPHVKHRTLPLSTSLNKPCRPPSQHSWDMPTISLPPFSFPFSKNLLFQYWDIQTWRQYCELHLIAFRRWTYSWCNASP